MGLVIPPAVNYQTPLVSLPVAWDRPPVEGSRIVPVEIDWGTMGGANNCVSINLFGGAAQTISQIVSVSIDNSACSVPVTFIFPDTAQTYEVKALTPVATFPVFTNQTQFFVSAPGALAADVTRFGLLNSLPPPVSLAESPFVPAPQVAAINSINIGAAGSNPIVAAGISGTLTGLFVALTLAPAALLATITVQDGTGKLIATATIQGGGGAGPTYVILFNMQGIDVPFTNGLNLQHGASAGSLANVNVFYTVP